jgi:hypothetical protein
MEQSGSAAHCRRCRHPPVPGQSHCARHLQRLREAVRRRRAKRKAKGLCPRCAAPKVAGPCLTCAAKRQAKLDRWRNAGLCTRCGSRPAPNRRYCEHHLALARRQSRSAAPRRRLPGYCHLCRKPSAPGRSLCARHLEYLVQAVQKRRKRLKEAGLCVDCGKRMAFATVRCLVCRANYVESALPLGTRKLVRQALEGERLEDQRNVIREALAEHRDELDERLVLVLHWYYGLDGNQRQKPREIAKRLCISRERARQLEQKALGLIGIKRPPRSRRVERTVGGSSLEGKSAQLCNSK